MIDASWWLGRVQPTGNLDGDACDDITALFDRLWREWGLTLVLVTHDAVVAKRGQRVGTMKIGRLSVVRSAG
nr:hypothetical protein GCM10020063_040100 [Dactylosporangium thailandense]